MIGFSNRTYACDSFMAELKATELGLLIAQNHNIHSAILFSGCTQVINLLCHNDGFSDKYVSVVENCRKLWKVLPSLKIKYCKLDHNKIADGLAKKCRITKDSANVTRVFPYPPSHCMMIYLAECKNT